MSRPAGFIFAGRPCEAPAAAQDGRQAACCSPRDGRGRATLTRVPTPGAESRSIDPPQRADQVAADRQTETAASARAARRKTGLEGLRRAQRVHAAAPIAHLDAQPPRLLERGQAHDVRRRAGLQGVVEKVREHAHELVAARAQRRQTGREPHRDAGGSGSARDPAKRAIDERGNRDPALAVRARLRRREQGAQGRAHLAHERRDRARIALHALGLVGSLA